VVPVPVPVPALVPVVLLAPLVCDSTNRTENTSPIYTGPSKIYVGHQPRTTVEIPSKIKDRKQLQVQVVKIGEVDSEIDSTIGVRQGSCEGPVLFLFIMQAAMETLEWLEGVSKPEFMTREYGKTTGERASRVRDASSFELWTSLFADDCVLLFQ